MADWNKPDLSSYEVDVLDELKNRDLSLARMFKGTTDTNLPVDSIRLDWTGLVGRFGKWNGTTWDTLTLSQDNLPSATSSVKGIAKIATTAEITERTSADTIVSPSGLASASVASADSVTNGVYTVGTQTIGGSKFFSNNIIVNSIRVGRGGGNVATNTAFGYDALFSNTTGSNNNAFGFNTLSGNIAGDNNDAFGFNALGTNTSGSNNNAFGRNALSGNTTGSNNIGVGRDAGTASSPFHVTNQSNRIILGNNDITNAYIKVAWTVTSDERDKTEITDLPVGLDFLNNLRPVSYQFKKGGRDSETGDGITRYGFLAQQVLGAEGDSPVIVDTEQEENLKLKESNLIAVLVKAVQELSAKVELLESQLTNK